MSQAPRNERARSITSMGKELDYDQTAPAFGNSSNRRYNFYTSRKSESSGSRPESRGEGRKSQPRTFDTEARSSDIDLDSTTEFDEMPSNPTSFLKDFQARKNRIASTTKKYEKYKSYTDQITKLTSKYSHRQLSPDSDNFSDNTTKMSETLEKNMSLGPERRSVTPTPPSPDNDTDVIPPPKASPIPSAATKAWLSAEENILLKKILDSWNIQVLQHIDYDEPLTHPSTPQI